jgi:hypothetical protein
VKRIIGIELCEEHEKVNFYTLRFKDEETEFNKFLDEFPENCKYDEDVQIIIRWIDKIGQDGALERRFKPEGKYHDRVFAIPIETCNLRIYVLRISDEIVILGNGGLKSTDTYEEDPKLNSYVKILQLIDRFLKDRIRTEKVTIFRKSIFGNVNFGIDDKGTGDEKEPQIRGKKKKN